MCGAFAERCLRGSTEIVEYKPVPVTLRPPEISPGLTWDRTLAPVARDWALGLCSCILLVLDTEHIVSCAGHRTHHVSRLDAKICVVGEVVCVACMNAVC